MFVDTEFTYSLIPVFVEKVRSKDASTEHRST